MSDHSLPIIVGALIVGWAIGFFGRAYIVTRGLGAHKAMPGPAMPSPAPTPASCTVTLHEGTPPPPTPESVRQTVRRP